MEECGSTRVYCLELLGFDEDERLVIVLSLKQEE
jgi:hypothetical protein